MLTTANNIETVIFDCDGVLVNSESLSCYALNVVFDNTFGIDIGTDYSPIIGTSLDFALTYYLDKHNLKDYDLEELKYQKEMAYFSLAENDLETFDLCESFIQLLISRSITVCVASSGSHKKIEFSLSKVGLLKYFKHRFSSSDVNRGKPYPDLFLYAADKMGVTSKNCLVIEDSINGITAGRKAGMEVIGFLGSFPEYELKNAGALDTIYGYQELIDWFT